MELEDAVVLMDSAQLSLRHLSRTHRWWLIEGCGSWQLTTGTSWLTDSS